MVAFADTSRAPALRRVVFLNRPPLEKSIGLEGPLPTGMPVWTRSGDGWYTPTHDYQPRLVGWNGRDNLFHDIGDFAIPSGAGKKLVFLDRSHDQNNSTVIRILLFFSLTAEKPHR